MNQSKKQPIKMTPGDDIHLSLLMAPHSLNLAVGQLREQLLGYGRAAFEAGKAGQCLHQIQEPAAAEQAAWHAGLDEGRAQATGSISNATSQHSTACLYGYALARLGLTDTPQMRVLFWDAHEALQWDEKTDRYITPSAEGECGQCGHVQEPAATQASEVTPIVVPDDIPSTDANTKYGESYGVDWVYEGKTAEPAAVAVPDGWQLVPMEGTEEMARAFRAEATPALFYMTTIQCTDFQERYRAMLEAAPALAATPAAAPVNCDSLEQLNKNKDLAAAAPVVLPEPSRWLMRDNHTFRKLPGDNAVALSVILSEFDTGHTHSSLFARDFSGKTIEDCVHCHGKRETLEAEARAWLERTRTLLATATGLPAQADGYPALPKGTGVWEFTSDTYLFTDEDMRAYVDADRSHRAAPQAQADARDDSALLDAMERQRIAVVPEYEGPWDAEVYNDEGKPNHRGSGSTPREAIRAAIAAAKGKAE